MKPNDTGMVNFNRGFVPPSKLPPGLPTDVLRTNQLFARVQVGLHGCRVQGGLGCRVQVGLRCRVEVGLGCRVQGAGGWPARLQKCKVMGL